jgi:hypothetical protein
MIPADVKRAFADMLRAAKQDRLVLMECVDGRTDRTEYTICIVTDAPGGEKDFAPCGVVLGGNPIEYMVPPDLGRVKL